MSDQVLRRDFSMFKENGINTISLSLYWYRIEGDSVRDYYGNTSDIYGTVFFQNINNVISIANDYDLQVLITFHNLWNESWNVPGYVIDPVTGRNIELAIFRDLYFQEMYIKAVLNAIHNIKTNSNIWAWAILNEPWYWPHELKDPYNHIDQKEMAIQLINNLTTKIKNIDTRPITIRFLSFRGWETNDGNFNWKNIFLDDWKNDNNLFESLDFISFNTYYPSSISLIANWINTNTANVEYITDQLGKSVYITEFGYYGRDSIQSNVYESSKNHFLDLDINGYIAWMWNSGTELGGGVGQPGIGFNLCKNNNGDPRTAFYTLTE